jgi:hypothetical protein
MGFMTYLNVFNAYVISSSVFTVKNIIALDVKGAVMWLKTKIFLYFEAYSITHYVNEL